MDAAILLAGLGLLVLSVLWCLVPVILLAILKQLRDIGKERDL